MPSTPPAGAPVKVFVTVTGTTIVSVSVAVHAPVALLKTFGGTQLAPVLITVPGGVTVAEFVALCAHAPLIMPRVSTLASTNLRITD